MGFNFNDFTLYTRGAGYTVLRTSASNNFSFAQKKIKSFKFEAYFVATEHGSSEYVASYKTMDEVIAESTVQTKN